MVKGKKKANKGRKKNSKNVREDTDVETLHITPEQNEMARLAAANRKEDPLKNWTRLQNEECPICMLPLPFEPSDTVYCVTCGKTVCMGCMLSTGIVHGRDSGDTEKAFEKFMTCPYCRSNTRVYDDKLTLEKEMKRASTGNGEAMYRVGNYYFHGKMGLRQDKVEGMKWYHRAVEAGSGTAAGIIGNCYHEGYGVKQDMEKAMEYFQKSAELGYIPAFSFVGRFHLSIGEIEESMLNLRKAVICGINEDGLFNTLRDCFKHGYITKEEYAFTLRESQKACNEMKSDGREKWKYLDAKCKGTS